MWAGGIVVDQLGVDADGGQRLAQIVAELFRLVEIGRRQQLEREAVAAGAPLVAGLVEQRVGLGDIEWIGRHVGGVELRVVLRHRAGGGGGIAEEHRLDDEVLVDGMRDRLANLEVGQFLAAVVDLDDELVGQPLIALGDHLDARHLGDAVEVGQRHGGEGGELDLFGL